MITGTAPGTLNAGADFRHSGAVEYLEAYQGNLNLAHNQGSLKWPLPNSSDLALRRARPDAAGRYVLDQPTGV